MRLASSSLASLSAIVFTLGATEGLAYWWMHPAPAGLGQPVLCYRPGAGGQRSEDRCQRSEVRAQEEEAALPSLEAPRCSSSIQNPKSKIQNPASVTDRRYTLLPDVVDKSMRGLHCTNGTAARIDLDDGITINLAFFEWDLSDFTSVHEAFKHHAESCMDSIGMTLIEKRPPRSYQVAGANLAFEHTVFRNPRGGIVHTFKATWVSGAGRLLGNDASGGVLSWWQVRWLAAFKRFNPAYARVAQGAVSGIANPALAWQAFEDAMLVDLKFEPSR